MRIYKKIKYVSRSKEYAIGGILCPIHGMSKTYWLKDKGKDKFTGSIGCIHCFKKLPIEEIK